MRWPVVRIGFLFLLTCLAWACSGSNESGLFVVLTDPPNLHGKTGSVFYLCRLEELMLDSAPFEEIYDRYDHQSVLAQSPEWVRLFRQRSQELNQLLSKGLTDAFLTQKGVPVRMVRLPRSGLDQQAFPSDAQFRKANFVSKSNRENGRQLLTKKP